MTQEEFEAKMAENIKKAARIKSLFNNYTGDQWTFFEFEEGLDLEEFRKDNPFEGWILEDDNFEYLLQNGESYPWITTENQPTIGLIFRNLDITPL